MCFKVGSKSPDTFKEKFPVTIVNNSLQLFPILKESSILHELQKFRGYQDIGGHNS